MTAKLDLDAPNRAPLKHAPMTIALHWASALLIAMAVSAVLMRDLADSQVARQILMQWHRDAGLMIIPALLARLLVIATVGMANTSADLPQGMRRIAKAVHAFLYLLLLAIPLLGWALTSAHNTPLKFLGMLPLPGLVQANADRADTLSSLHALAAWTLLFAVMAHSVAALYHHYVRRDEILAAMLPDRRSAPSSVAPSGAAGASEPRAAQPAG